MSIPPDQGRDNPWALPLGGCAAVQAEPEQSALQVETIEGVEPLDIQIGVFPKKAVPDVLYDALFGQPDPTAAEIEAAGGDPAAVPPMQTYAILDGAKVTNLPELLERSGLEHRCLFKGAGYDELKNVAPWIVRLEEDNAFTRNLFTRSDAHWHLWDREPGIYVRSRGTLADMWRHFRKLTRVKTDSGQWLFFRFYEPEVAGDFLEVATKFPMDLIRLSRVSDVESIFSYAVFVDNTSKLIVRYSPTNETRFSNSGGAYVVSGEFAMFLSNRKKIRRLNMIVKSISASERDACRLLEAGERLIFAGMVNEEQIMEALKAELHIPDIIAANVRGADISPASVYSMFIRIMEAVNHVRS